MTSNNKWNNKIIQLDRKQWGGHQLMFRYTAHNYYDLEIIQSEDGFITTLTKKPFDVPFVKKPDDTDKLFQPWWDDVKAWGIVENEQLIAVIETAVEGWSNRLIVTELWIDCKSQALFSAIWKVEFSRIRKGEFSQSWKALFSLFRKGEFSQSWKGVFSDRYAPKVHG